MGRKIKIFLSTYWMLIVINNIAMLLDIRPDRPLIHIVQLPPFQTCR